MPRTGKPKTGRPKNTPDQVKYPLHAYLVATEFEKLRELSERWDLSLSSTVKRLILEKELEKI